MYFEPGVRGRKTGLTVPDTGIRDEMGMEPIDDLFSSPEKTIVMAPPPPPAQTAALASARKPAPKQAPAKTPKVVTKTPAPAPKSQAPAPRSQAPKTAQKAPIQQQKQQQQQQNGARQVPTADETNSMEESMQIGNSTMPEPTAVLTERRKAQYIPPPKSKSPTKTFLGSPARRHPSIQPISGPTRGEVVMERERVDKEPVARKLNFSNGDDVFATTNLSAPTPEQGRRVPKSPAPAQTMQKPIIKTPSATNSKRKRVSLEKENGAHDEVQPEDIPAPDSVRSMPGGWEEPTPFPSQKKSDRSFDLSPSNDGEDEYVPQPMDMDEDVEMEEVNYETILEKTATPEPEVVRPITGGKKKARVSLEKQKEDNAKDKGKGKEVVIAENKKPGRPKSKEAQKEATIPMTQAAEYLAIDEASRIYSSDDEAVLPPAKKSKLSSKDVNRKISIKKASQLAKDVESSPVQIQRGPPRPRQNGLFILRRETPALSSFPAARVGLGRPGIKPSAYWRNEDEEGDTIFEPAAPQPASRREEPSSPPNGARKSSKREIEEQVEEELDLAEPWETEPGCINGLIKEWNASDKSGDTVMERDDEIALSGPAIITRPIPGSEVQFAKTLTLPFFGSGMVDLPPGAIKKPKNSRKMQMVFFVHKGNVKVTVNGNEFRISVGGMWQVPRGNFYSIENDYEKEARIFFSQGCEVKTELE